MSAVWYLSPGDRIITAAQWTAAGIAGSPADSNWNSSNGWSIPAASFTAPQLVILAADGGFNTTAPDGPNTARAASGNAGATLAATQAYVDTQDAKQGQWGSGSAVDIMLRSVMNQLRRQHTRSRRLGALSSDIASVSLDLVPTAALTRSYAHPTSGITNGQARALTPTEIAAMPYDPGQGRPQVFNVSGTGYGINSPTAANTDLAGQTLWPFIAQRTAPLMFDGDKLDITLYNGGVANNTYQIYIDELPLFDKPQAVAGGAGYLHLIFPSAKPRLIEVRTNCYIGTLFWGPLYTVWKPAPMVGPRLFVLGASYCAPIVYNGTTGALDKYMYGMWQQIADLLDIQDIWVDGVSGSGFLTAGGGIGTPNNKFIDRAQGIINSAPDRLVVTDAFVNDLYNSQTVANIVTAANTFFTTIRNALPNIGITCFTGSRAPLLGDLAANMDLCVSGLQAIRTDLNFVNSSRWIDMAGYTPGHTTGGGNSDPYIGNDGQHLTIEGHAYEAVRAAMPLQRIWANNYKNVVMT